MSDDEWVEPSITRTAMRSSRVRRSPSPDSFRHGAAESLGTMCVVKFRELIRLLEGDGWLVVAQRGSHQQYEHPSKPGKVTVAGKPGADVPKGTAANILRQAGLRRSSR
jgi:predicted RNA binding protein YcfA (HicA-like mRNA interferase family)